MAAGLHSSRQTNVETYLGELEAPGSRDISTMCRSNLNIMTEFPFRGKKDPLTTLSSHALCKLQKKLTKPQLYHMS